MKLTTTVHSRGCGNPLYPATTTPSFRCSTPESRPKQPSISSPQGRAPAHPPAKARHVLAYRSALALFAWSVALLISDQAQAAGVCIVCPPGHTCPINGTPVISGTPGQILARTATGTEWVDVATAALQGPQGPQGPQGATGGQPPDPLRDQCNALRLAHPLHAEGICAGRLCFCHMKHEPWSHYMPQCPNNMVPVRSFRDAHGGPFGCTGGAGNTDCWHYCRTTTHWRIQ